MLQSQLHQLLYAALASGSETSQQPGIVQTHEVPSVSHRSHEAKRHDTIAHFELKARAFGSTAER